MLYTFLNQDAVLDSLSGFRSDPVLYLLLFLLITAAGYLFVRNQKLAGELVTHVKDSGEKANKQTEKITEALTLSVEMMRTLDKKQTESLHRMEQLHREAKQGK